MSNLFVENNFENFMGIDKEKAGKNFIKNNEGYISLKVDELTDEDSKTLIIENLKTKIKKLEEEKNLFNELYISVLQQLLKQAINGEDIKGIKDFEFLKSLYNKFEKLEGEDELLNKIINNSKNAYFKHYELFLMVIGWPRVNHHLDDDAYHLDFRPKLGEYEVEKFLKNNELNKDYIIVIPCYDKQKFIKTMTYHKKEQLRQDGYKDDRLKRQLIIFNDYINDDYDEYLKDYNILNLHKEVEKYIKNNNSFYLNKKIFLIK